LLLARFTGMPLLFQIPSPSIHRASIVPDSVSKYYRTSDTFARVQYPRKLCAEGGAVPYHTITVTDGLPNIDTGLSVNGSDSPPSVRGAWRPWTGPTGRLYQFIISWVVSTHRQHRAAKVFPLGSVST
jgi:hypothetical protein